MMHSEQLSPSPEQGGGGNRTKAQRAKSPLRILLLDNDPDGREWMGRILGAARIRADIQAVGGQTAYECVLMDRQFDVIIADLDGAGFDSFKALTLAQQRCPWVPFLFMSKAPDEAHFNEALQQGAVDCVAKRDHRRLVSAVRRATRLANERTGRLRAEAALRESHALSSAILDAAMDCIIGVDSVGRVIEFNRSAERTFGCTHAEALGQMFKELILPPGPRRETCPGPAGYLGTETARQEELNVRRRDGSEFPAEMTFAQAGRTESPVYTVVLRDITERKRSEQSRAQAEEKYRSIFENTREGIFQTTREGRYLTVNPALAKIYGYDSPDELMASLTDIARQLYVDPEHRSRLVHMLEEQDSVSGFEAEVYRRDGSRIWIIENVRAVRDAAGNLRCYEGTVVDITERKLLESQLRHSQKMDAIGQLAGGVAHDFNNLLTIISASCELLLLDAKLTPDERETLGQIQAAGDRASALTRQLLTFSRKQIPQLRPLDLNQVVKGFGKMLQRLIGADIALEWEHAPQLPSVRADVGMIEQALMNLAVNARDAMPNGGRLLIKTQAVSIDDDYVKRHPNASAGTFVSLSVEDSGCGMSAEVLARIFEPFFTTKGAGKGTGLGLATVYGIVQQHGGWVEVASRVGSGTAFHILLPATLDRMAKCEKLSDTTALPRGSGTILFVEDELNVRVTSKVVLERQGYRVLEADSGVAAMKLWGAHADEIRLLLTDIVLPDGMTGSDLAGVLQRRKPELKVLYISGYSLHTVGRNITLETSANFLQKPFSARQLIQAVQGSVAKETRPGQTAAAIASPISRVPTSLALVSAAE